MKKNSVMVKSVLMSMITAVAFVFGFASCSDEDPMANESMNPEMEQAYDGPALKSLGLNYQDFVAEGDVTILDADTTQISVSKAFADKLGIKSFAGHPMGIWESMDNDSYMCKATIDNLSSTLYDT